MKVLTRGTVTIDVLTCKGCELCIAACPPIERPPIARASGLEIVR